MSAALTNFAYILHGDNASFYLEASHSIGTLRRHMDPQTARILVFTDDPERIRSWPVTAVSIAGQVSEMKGPAGFEHRVKLCCLIQCLASHPGDLIYLDSDTIIRRPVERLLARLQAGHLFMHRRNSLAFKKSPLQGLQVRLPDGTDYRYGPEACMFNAGVIGLHRADAPLLQNALAICDAQLQRPGGRHISEQVAVSEALRLSGRKMLEADDVVTHYYRRSAKKFMRHQIARQAARQNLEPWNFAQPTPYSYLRVQWNKLVGSSQG